MNVFSYKSVTEHELSIDLPNTNGLKIKGLLRGDYFQPLAIIVHGRPGSGNELLPFLYARYLYEHGIASLRLFMYDFTKDTRNLIDCTLETYSSDFDVVVGSLRAKGVVRIFGVGHSYGGLTILKASAKLDAAVLWDPTHGLVFTQETENEDYGEFPELDFGDIIVVSTGYGYISSKKEKAYDMKLGDNTELASNKGYPLKIISAGKGVMTNYAKKYIEVADTPKEHVTIADARHQFDDSDDVITELFNESTAWLNKYLG
jgi:dienelactone hydrolase